jgi:hypothetical protein
MVLAAAVIAGYRTPPPGLTSLPTADARKMQRHEGISHRDPILSARLSNLTVPALVLRGASDQIVDADHGRAPVHDVFEWSPSPRRDTTTCPAPRSVDGGADCGRRSWVRPTPMNGRICRREQEGEEYVGDVDAEPR